MTNAEAIKTLRLAQAEVEWEYPMDIAAAIDVAVKALEKAEKYRWHDLRKNPEDLPEEDNEEVLVLKRDGIVAVVYAYTLKGSTKLFKAWRYIDPYNDDTEALAYTE